MSVRYAPGCHRLQPSSAYQPRGLRWPAHRPRFRHGCTLHEESDVHPDHVRLVRLAQARHRTGDQGRPSTDAQSPSAVARDDDAVRGDQSSKRRCSLAARRQWTLAKRGDAGRSGGLGQQAKNDNQALRHADDRSNRSRSERRRGERGEARNTMYTKAYTRKTRTLWGQGGGSVPLTCPGIRVSLR